MPVWHEATKALQDQDRFQTVGIILEQHPERCRLFMQWKQMDWPVMVDSLNLLGMAVVPVTVAIDEHGIVRMVNPRPNQIEKDFLDREFEPPAETATTVKETIGEADRLVLTGEVSELDEAIVLYGKRANDSPEDGTAHFRLGVAYRMRYDSDRRQPDDFANAVAHWGRSMEIDPNNYIRRRRIQQYGPRLMKPYPFYDWVTTARAEVQARGDTPVALRVEPGGTEIAKPASRFSAASESADEPDPDGRIHRDKKGFIDAEITVVPDRVAPGKSARVHLVFRPNERIQAHWNNEAKDTVVWVNPLPGWQVDARQISIARAPQPVSAEARRVEFEVQVPADAKPGRIELPAYVLYYVCEDVKGQCLYRRQDLKIPVTVSAPAP